MTTPWEPHREPLRATLSRTIVLAVVVGGVVAWRFGRLQWWPAAAGLALWFTFGGHWVELWFLNRLRPRLPRSRTVQAIARVTSWFLAGVGLGFGVLLTMRVFALAPGVALPAWWVAGLLFVGVELIVHAVLFLRRRPNAFTGAG